MNVPVPVRPTNTMAIVSLVLGILSWIALPFVGAVGAVICGHMARSEIRRAPGVFEGDGMALAGLILGYIHLALFVLVLFFVFFVIGSAVFFAHFH